MKKYKVDDEDLLLTLLLSQTRDTLAKVRQQELKKYTVSPIEVGVICLVHDYGTPGLTPAAISRWMFRESQSTTGLISRMQKKGLVEKVRDEMRKGGTRIVLTPRGKEIYIKTARRDGFVKILSCLSRQERDRLKSSLQRVRMEALKQLGMKDAFRVPKSRGKKR